MVSNSSIVNLVESVDFSHRSNSESVNVGAVSNAEWPQEEEVWVSVVDSVDGGEEMVGLVHKSN